MTGHGSSSTVARRGADDQRTEAAALDVLRLRAAVGLPVGDAGVTPRAQRALTVAQGAGAPVLPALDAAAAAEDDVLATRRAVAVASAQTKAVAGGLLAAPFVLVPALGRLFGADLMAFYATGLGRAVAAVGLLLLGLGAAAVVVLVRRVGAAPPARSAVRRAARAVAGALLAGLVVHPAAGLVAAALLWRGGSNGPATAPDVDEAADLTATALTGGVGPGEALRIAAGVLPSLAPDLRGLALELELGLAPRPAGAMGRLGGVLCAATDIGAPAAPALRRLACELRADERARVLAAAERLPAQLTFPTALALLPATLLLVGAPIVQVGLQQAIP